MANKKIKINRAPVLTLWAAIVAERLGFDEDTALTLGGLARRPAPRPFCVCGRVGIKV